MKTLLPLCFIFYNLCLSQTYFVSNEFVVSNPTRDTVYIKNDITGKNIYSSWRYDPYYEGKKVTTILVEDLAPYHQRYKLLAETNTTAVNKRKKKDKKANNR